MSCSHFYQLCIKNQLYIHITHTHGSMKVAGEPTQAFGLVESKETPPAVLPAELERQERGRRGRTENGRPASGERSNFIMSCSVAFRIRPDPQSMHFFWSCTSDSLLFGFGICNNSIKNQKIRFHELQTNLYSYYCLSKSVLDDILSFTIIESSAMIYVLFALHIVSANAGNHAKRCVFPNEPRVAYYWDENCKLGCLETLRLVMFCSQSDNPIEGIDGIDRGM